MKYNHLLHRCYRFIIPETPFPRLWKVKKIIFVVKSYFLIPHKLCCFWKWEYLFLILLYYSCSVLKGLIIPVVVYQRHRNRLLSLTPYRLNPSRDTTQSSSLIKTWKNWSGQGTCEKPQRDAGWYWCTYKSWLMTRYDIKTSLFVGVLACVSISLLVVNGILNKVKSVL